MRAVLFCIFLVLLPAPSLTCPEQAHGAASGKVRSALPPGLAAPSNLDPLLPYRTQSDNRLQERLEFDSEIQAMVDGVQLGDLEHGVGVLESFGTRHSLHLGGYGASVWIRDFFEYLGYTDVSLHDYNDWNDNVVCVKRGGVHPDRYVVIGGHYDSVGYFDGREAPGADDNASGTIGVLEVARALADYDFEYSVVFIAFSGEEQGLVGSSHWAAEAAADGKQIVGMINLDMICYSAEGDERKLDIVADEQSEPLLTFAIGTLATYLPGNGLETSSLGNGGSDHVSFWEQGYRALFLTEDLVAHSPFIHSPEDRIGNSANDFPFMLNNVRAAIALTATLARPFHVSLAHSPQLSDPAAGPFTLSVVIQTARPLDLSSLRLIYRFGGGIVQSLPLLPTLDSGNYEATIPIIARGTLVEYYITATDEAGNKAVHPENAPVDLHRFYAGVTLVASEDAEDTEETDEWILGLPDDDATGGHWVRANPVGTAYQPEDDHSPDPGENCFVTGNAEAGEPGGANDVDGGKTTLISPPFDLSRAIWAEVSYWRWIADETHPDDEFKVDLSNDGGITWVNLERVEGSAFPWQRAAFSDLGEILPLTNRMRLRFIAEDRGAGSLVEALVDDLSILAVYSAPEEPNGPGTPPFAARLEAYPNPFNPRTRLSFELPASGQAEIKIYNGAGAEVARIPAGLLSAGAHERYWNAGGLASGVYLARLSLDGRPLQTNKLTLLK